jgi:excinuclease ABC subunit A
VRRLRDRPRPEGGDKGGTIVAAGTPEEVVKADASHTAKYLADVLSRASEAKPAAKKKRAATTDA